MKFNQIFLTLKNNNFSMEGKTMKVQIFDIQRFADISNSKSNTVVTGTADADNTSNDAENVTI